MFVSRLWEEGIPADGIRPFKDLTPRDWSTAPPVGKPKGYAPAHKFANWEVVLRTHLGRFVTATKPKVSSSKGGKTVEEVGLSIYLLQAKHS